MKKVQRRRAQHGDTFDRWLSALCPPIAATSRTAPTILDPSTPCGRCGSRNMKDRTYSGGDDHPRGDIGDSSRANKFSFSGQQQPLAGLLVLLGEGIGVKGPLGIDLPRLRRITVTPMLQHLNRQLHHHHHHHQHQQPLQSSVPAVVAGAIHYSSTTPFVMVPLYYDSYYDQCRDGIARLGSEKEDANDAGTDEHPQAAATATVTTTMMIEVRKLPPRSAAGPRREQDEGPVKEEEEEVPAKVEGDDDQVAAEGDYLLIETDAAMNDNGTENDNTAFYAATSTSIITGTCAKARKRERGEVVARLEKEEVEEEAEEAKGSKSVKAAAGGGGGRGDEVVTRSRTTTSFTTATSCTGGSTSISAVTNPIGVSGCGSGSSASSGSYSGGGIIGRLLWIDAPTTTTNKYTTTTTSSTATNTASTIPSPVPSSSSWWQRASVPQRVLAARTALQLCNEQPLQPLRRLRPHNLPLGGGGSHDSRGGGSAGGDARGGSGTIAAPLSSAPSNDASSSSTAPCCIAAAAATAASTTSTSAPTTGTAAFPLQAVAVTTSSSAPTTGTAAFPLPLQAVAVAAIPGLFLVPDFLSPEEEDAILRHELPPPPPPPELRPPPQKGVGGGNESLLSPSPPPLSNALSIGADADWEVLHRRKVRHYNRPFRYDTMAVGATMTAAALGDAGADDRGNNKSGASCSNNDIKRPFYYDALVRRLHTGVWEGGVVSSSGDGGSSGATAPAIVTFSVTKIHHDKDQARAAQQQTQHEQQQQQQQEHEQQEEPSSWPVPPGYVCDQLTINLYQYNSNNTGSHSNQHKNSGIAHHVDAHTPFGDVIFAATLGSATVMEFHRPCPPPPQPPQAPQTNVGSVQAAQAPQPLLLNLEPISNPNDESGKENHATTRGFTNNGAVNPNGHVPQQRSRAAASIAATMTTATTTATTPYCPYCVPLPTARCAVFLPRRSLVIMTGEARYHWTHSIAERAVDVLGEEEEEEEAPWCQHHQRQRQRKWQTALHHRGTRLSLTFRRARDNDVRETAPDGRPLHRRSECPYPFLCDGI